MKARILLMPFLLMLAGGAHADAIERLFMPGEVIEGHAKYEHKCESCHSDFEKTSQTSLCRDCHEKIDADIESGNGFHGRMANAQAAECTTCHTEHKGRNANIVPLDPETFDHGLTDFKLKGAHRIAKCASCHKPEKKRRETPTDCYSCHKKDDRHEGEFGKKCADCHGQSTWAKAEYDHDKTGFPLEGAHEKALCASCHPSERYKNTPKQCVACHGVEDVHGGRYGRQCDDCHKPVEWKKIQFNHDKTEFPLRARHRQVACDTCHTGDLYQDDLPTKCNGCHKDDDVHRGKNGPKCNTCHDERGWDKGGFDHDADTDFPLRGAHGDLNCESCHKGDVYKVKLETDCYSCHRGDDHHHGGQGKKCQSCHNETSWSSRIRFDHDLTEFPLIGMHAAAPCEVCHLTAAYTEAPKECVRCHDADDAHERRLGTRCADCHTPNDWSVWKFDHDRQTDFKLTGKHEGLACLSCHLEPMTGEVIQSSSCGSCHKKDDIHLGRFGQRCERCHTSESFKDLNLPGWSKKE